MPSNSDDPVHDESNTDVDTTADDYGHLTARLRRREAKSAGRTATRERSRRDRSQFLAARALLDGGDSLPDGAAFVTTYHPGRFEEGWLMESVRGFYEDGLIVDVLAQIKGGKEANVYLCQANPDTGLDLLVAKVYRPRKFRNLRNDAVYREGREILSSEGTAVSFRVTDGAASVPVSYTGLLPDLFGENQGMIATGRLVNGTFEATEILAKHDETYMPREVIDALKEQGIYVDPNAGAATN